MQKLSFDRISYLKKGKRVFLISGEIHYFRVPRTDWRKRLELFKASGGNCVATYVPWLLHEPKEGKYDFSSSQLEVDEFLKLCNELKLWALVRPGPYQYSELAYDGLPGWLCEVYPELRARNIEGKDFRVSSVSYLHPLFLEKASKWYSKVVPLLAKHQVSSGGAVAAFQIDNELMGIHEWFGSWDYHPDTYGVGRNEGRWPAFLAKRYGGLDGVNAAHGIKAGSWADVTPIAAVASGTPSERRRVKDYQDCYFASVAEYATTLAGWMREKEVQVPIVHNSANPYMNGYFEATVAAMGKDFLLGSDHYYNLDMDWDQNNPTPKYATKCFHSNETMRHYGTPPTVFELPGGSASDYPPITPHDAGCCYLANIAYGMKGYNYYIFTGGVNPPGAGTTGEIYDYGAAVSSTGEVRDLYKTQQKLARFLKKHSWLAGAEQVPDCQLGLSREYSRSGRYCGDNKGIDFSNNEAWDFMRKGFMMTSFCGSFSPSLADLASDSLLDRVDLALMIASSVSMARDIQERIVRFLEAGGKILIAPVIPTMDETFSPCTVLADYLGGVTQKPHKPMAALLTAFDVPNVYVNGGLFATSSRPSKAVTTAFENRAGTPLEIGWRLDLPSGGAISVLGLHWKQAKREHESMLARALSSLGVEQRVRCDNPNIWTVLRSDGKHSMLFVLNLLTSPMTARISFRDPVSSEWVDTGTHEMPGITVRAWSGGKTIYK
ncbi:MAG: beta-galactosidase [Victivallales bacterium]